MEKIHLKIRKRRKIRTKQILLLINVMTFKLIDIKTYKAAATSTQTKF